MSSELGRLQEILERKGREIMRNRKNYRRLVGELYEATQPFEKPRHDTKENFAEELRILAEMIGHCVVLGDSEVLYTYAVKPIRRNPRVLSSFQRMDSYLHAFYSKYKISESDSEKFYLGKLINELKILSGNKKKRVHH